MLRYIGKNLRMMRWELGINLTEMGKRMGITREWIRLRERDGLRDSLKSKSNEDA